MTTTFHFASDCHLSNNKNCDNGKERKEGGRPALILLQGGIAKPGSAFVRQKIGVNKWLKGEKMPSA